MVFGNNGFLFLMDYFNFYEKTSSYTITIRISNFLWAKKNEMWRWT